MPGSAYPDFWQHSPPLKPKPLSLPISTAGQRWTPALPVCLCEPAQANFAGLCALRAPCLYIGFGAGVSWRYAYGQVTVRRVGSLVGLVGCLGKTEDVKIFKKDVEMQ
jgi:hypothetical protein